MAEDEDGPVKACCEAIDGLHIAPWEAYGKRYMKPARGPHAPQPVGARVWVTRRRSSAAAGSCVG
jgi:hypothetical protein